MGLQYKKMIFQNTEILVINLIFKKRMINIINGGNARYLSELPEF